MEICAEMKPVVEQLDQKVQELENNQLYWTTLYLCHWYTGTVRCNCSPL